MIKTIPFDLTTAFITGSFLALTARRQLKETTRLLSNRYFYLTLALGLIFFVPVGLWYYHQYPHWSLMYFIPPRRLSLGKDPFTIFYYQTRIERGVALLITLGYPSTIITGFLLNSYLIRRARLYAARAIMAGGVAAAGIFSYLTYDRLFFLGSYQSYRRGSMVPLTAEPELLKSLFLVGGVFLLIVGAMAIWFYRARSVYDSPGGSN